MKRRHLWRIALAVAALTAGLGAEASDDQPPPSLLRENVAKAEAILAGSVIAADKLSGHMAATTFRVSQVYRGPFHPGDQLTYFSFRESAAYDKRWLDHGVIVFLVHEVDGTGATQWGSAIDFSEFEYTPALEGQVRLLMARPKGE